MENERKRIIQLVENGTISSEEAIVLLEALSKEKESTQEKASTPLSVTNEEEKTTDYSKAEEPKFEKINNDKKSKNSFEEMFNNMFNNKDTNNKMNEFFNDLKQDLSHFSHKVMDLMNSTYTKVKDFDFEFPFGDKVEFEKTYEFNSEEVRGFEIELPSGKIDVAKGESDKIFVEAHVKTVLVNKDEEKTKADFEQKFVTLKDGKLDITTPSKMSQVSLRLVLPEKQYDLLMLRLLNGSITISNIDTKIVKIKSYNGAVKVQHTTFETATINGGNGAIELRHVTGDELEAETVNGRIYIDGNLQEIEAESVNGAVVVTTTSNTARKMKATTVAGAVEIYIPKTVSLNGQVSTNFGKADIGLADVTIRSEEEQFLSKTQFFEKIIEDASTLRLLGESRTGSIIVRYTLQS
ncbi:hypothetical protein CD30_10725 [Ureibacillus massiliensis 4400831 = CIP 108448 = CCUG 49529]|uniref:Uncharacterized protein n=1 Tax=Ureibacillus massiliensis 4400831 = CIP 108448 = CCUG 49529 TaxID=1211035 RepID=A0A0A3J0J3_9BACL|nr:DUF4097 family beta strand repeat-containing protein [Ureibacillus massiliensis]KGR90539.1 hypothetical protein CD30_10725 [Ureibacillus massiliensis 4400831 = CIP 108448 = CCUG 49529]